MHIFFKVIVLSLTVLTTVNSQKREVKKQPNIIVIMADDMGYADTGFTGSKNIKTPHLDKMASAGVVFSQGYVTHAFCGPSRAGLLSGRYQHRFGFDHNPAYDPNNPYLGISTKEILFPARMQKVGYTTGIIGKWHLGAAYPFNPMNRGFNYFYGFLGGGHDYYKVDVSRPFKENYLHGLIRNKRPADFKGYLTTALSNDAVDFVKENKEKPFFLYLSYNAPHQPLQAPKEDIERYAHIKDKKRRVYAAMVDVMDQGIGKVIKALEDNEIAENTLVFFLSDNGGPIPSKRLPKRGNGSSNAPFRGGKTDYFDGGVHVPFIAYWPSVLKGGQVYDKPVISIDISKTAVELAGADASEGNGMEGENLIPLLTGKKKEAPHNALFWKFRNNWAVLSDGYKHIKNSPLKEAGLFNLKKDAGEQNNIVSKNKKVAESLRSKWQAWDKQNMGHRIGSYAEFERKREQFFEESLPEGAKKSDYFVPKK